MSIKDYSTLYFRNRKIEGVEPAPVLIKRLNENSANRPIIYGDDAKKLESCLFFRNQLFVSALSGTSGEDGQKVKQAAQKIELAFQTGEDEFLAACESEMHTEVGTTFSLARKQFIGTD